MAKSAGNFVTIRQILENWQDVGWPGEAVRFNMLRTHYRQPIDWTVEALDEAHKILWTWSDSDERAIASQLPTAVIDNLSNDLNTPGMIADLHKLHRSGEGGQVQSALRFLGFSGKKEKLGRKVHVHVHARASASTYAHGEVRRLEPGGVLEGKPALGAPVLEEKAVQALVNARTVARAAKNWAESDRIRDELAAMGIALKDNKEGTTTWEVAR
jgi:cysteinyl-tRNA synthetase